MDFMVGTSTDDTKPSAATEKDLGNEYYKLKKFKEAIDCYSRSIALSPTSVAFANRAMSYLKLKRFKEAEDDCTEVLNLDDRYVKAYSRRASARKELGKLKGAMDDADFAVRLEPNNKELRKQYDEIKTLYLKETNKKVPESARTSAEIKDLNGPSSSDSQKVKLSTANDMRIHTDVGTKTAAKVAERTASGSNEVHDARLGRQKPGQQRSMQDLVSNAASIYMATSDQSVVTPKSAYEFEVAWRALSDDVAKQAKLLKSIEPDTLPEIFKNALSTTMLMDIIKSSATFIREDMGFVVKVLYNLTKVPRFDMIVMCLSPLNQSELRRIWDEALFVEGIGMDEVEALTQLRPKFLRSG